MSRILLPTNTSHSIVVNNGSTQLPFVFNANGTFTLTSTASGNYKAIISPANITSSDKTFTLPDRSGNVALEDITSLLAMLPALTNGYFLTTNGTTVSWAPIPSASLSTLNGINCTTYNAQTLVIGTSGTAPNWVSQNSNTNTHTLNIPLASTASVTAGLLSNADYLNFAKKDASNTFSAGQTFNGASSIFANAPTITTPGTDNNSVATYGQLLAMKASLAARTPVDLLDTVTTATTLAGVATVDTIAVTVGVRVLATALTGGNAGKVYKCLTTGPTTWALETDGQNADGTPADGDILFIKQGGVYHDQQWAYNGTAWVLYNVAQSWSFSTGLDVSGSTVTVKYGTTAGTACAGNDSRLSDSRTPTAHQLDSATYHTISGKTAGQVVIATSATTFGFVTFSGDITSISAAGAVTIGKINGVAINDLGLKQNSATLVDNTSTPTLVTGCSWAIATYRSIKIEYSISRGAGNYVTGYIALLHDGTTPRITVIEDDSIGTHGITFSTDINSGNIRLLYKTTSSGTAATMRFFNYTFPI